MSTEQKAAILHEFIADEAGALARRECGDFWPMNHHRVVVLLPKASKLLEPGELVDLYFHLLRIGGRPKVQSEDEFNALQEGYRRTLSVKHLGYPAVRFDPLQLGFAFGYDEKGPVSEGSESTLVVYGERLVQWRSINASTNVPGLLKRVAKLKELADGDEGLAKHLAALLCRVDLSGVLPFASGGPWLWAMVVTALQRRAEGEAVVRKLVETVLPTEKRETTLDVLRRCVVACDRQDLQALIM